MNKKSLALAAAVLGLLSTTAFAITPEVHNQVTASIKFDVAPTPSKVVAPSGVPQSCVGATIMLSLTIDEAGRPHDIQVVSAPNRAATKCMVKAVSQWEFTPAQRNGLPVATKVLLPVQLEESANS